MKMEDVLLYMPRYGRVHESAKLSLESLQTPLNRDHSAERLHKNVVDGECQNLMKLHVV